MLELAEEIGVAWSIGRGVENMVLRVFSPQGEYEAGLAFLEDRLARARQTQDEVLAAQIQLHKAFLLLDLGQLEPALELAQALLSDADRLLMSDDRMNLLAYVGLCQAELGRFDQARESFRAGLDRAGQAGATQADAWSVAPAYIAYLEGDRVGLRRAMEQVQQRDVSPPAFNFVHNQAARLHLALGDAELALESSNKAMQPDMLLGEGCWLEQYYLTHARVLRALGRDAEADDYLQRAYERVMLVASKIQDETLRRGWLENIPDNREIVAEWEARAKSA
jgi:tetratricopeptide (TPR) repeat protein